uniref:Interferon-related developmental regulator N-terminal domain-containing protein n=1 Tax=Spumella elongata TaxID=89044 RepID=A0A7S3M9H0_9STRA|mmetsp:Transcript_39287/g.68035  ORF Transcript_39287/g.68035 Transcript_39287/m.68035 type:complete len:471 (+) Transcript_39287:105-1517(+)
MGKKSKIKALQKKIGGETAGDSSDEELDDVSVTHTTDERPTTPVRSKAPDSVSSVSELVEKLTDKRFTTREAGLDLLIKHFQSSRANSDDLSIEGYQDTILTHLQRIVRKPFSAKEGKLCAHLLSLIGLHLGPDEDEFFKNFEKPLRQLVDGTNPVLQDVRGPALSCLALLAYICGGVDAGFKIWSYCERILKEEALAVRESDSEHSGSDDDSDDDEQSQSTQSSTERPSSSVSLRSAAAEAWVLLATLRTPEEVLTHSQGEGDSILEPLLELLQFHDGTGNNIEVKVTAGKALAFLWEVASEAEGGAGASPTELGTSLCSDPNTVQQILETIKQISKDSSKRISKKDRKEQRAEFRVIEDFVLKGEPPEESLRMQGAVLELNSFKELHIVETLRTVLGTGFHSALRLYPVVKDVLGVEYLTDHMDGAGDDNKVNKGSSADKTRSNYRKQDRKYRQMNADTMYDAGDYED